MEPKITKRNNEEAQIQEAVCRLLRQHQWFVKETHGNMYQCGFPDLYATHRNYGARWIEIKKPVGYVFTPAQSEYFPLFCANGAGIWILCAATTHEYEKLFQPYNWITYLNNWNVR